MWRLRIITVSSIVFGALLFIAGSAWNWDNKTSTTTTIEGISNEVPSIEVAITSSQGTQSANVSVVVPPYVIVNSTWGSWQGSPQQNEMRVFTETSHGLYSESAALRLTGRNFLPMSYVD